MNLSNSSKMKQADQDAIASGISSETLMYRAAAYLAEEAENHLCPGTAVTVFCGSGNNGGDGIAAAVILREKGIPCHAFLVGRRESMTADALSMEKKLRKAGGVLLPYSPEDTSLLSVLKQSSVVIDAIFGIGLNREISGNAYCAIEQINKAEAFVISADIASGVSADSGCILGIAVKADLTVTFSMAKPGHFIEPGCICCGVLRVCPIGIPDSFLSRAYCSVEVLQAKEISLPKRDVLTHKGNYGKIGILAGSINYSGAPNLCSNAAARSGAGLVYLAVPQCIHTICAVKNAEAMVLPLPEKDGCISERALDELKKYLVSWDVLAIGPGLGRNEEIRSTVKNLLLLWNKCLVLDADALWAISDSPELLKNSKAKIVITPHEGEFRRLYPAMTGDRLQDALTFSNEHHCTVVLKGYRTIIAYPDGHACVVAAGNPGMAKGGSGDVLTGIIAAFLGQLPFEKAVPTACMLHAMAGDVCAQNMGEYGMLPTDMIQALPEIMKSVTLS